MLKIYQKYVTNNEKITKDELEQANKQFSDLLKGLGLLVYLLYQEVYWP